MFTRLAALTTIGIIASLAGLTTTAGAQDTPQDCAEQNRAAFDQLSFSYGGVTTADLGALTGAMVVGGQLTVNADLKTGCESTPLVLAFHATHETAQFDPNETQPLIADFTDFSGPITIPASIVAGQCNIQVDFALRSVGLAIVDKAHRYNEPSADSDGDGVADGVGIDRLIHDAGYATGECVTAPTTTSTVPEPTTSTTPITTFRGDPLPPLTETPTTTTAVVIGTPTTLLATVPTLPVTGTDTTDLAALGGIFLTFGIGALGLAFRLRRRPA